MLCIKSITLFSIIVLLFSKHITCSKSGETSDEPSKTGGSMPIIIKDSGVVEMRKGDVAMIFYMTATNTGHQPVHLYVNSTICCQTIAPDDDDCESMTLFGGDMGELYPQDTRNLTLFYANLILHNRIGFCSIDISNKVDTKMTQEVKFNTMLIKAGGPRIPRLLENYYNPDDLLTCESVDEDPLNMCDPYPCFIRYDGTRNFYNHTRRRCETLLRCLVESGDPAMAYVSETNTCKTLLTSMSTEDLAQFTAGKPSVTELTHAHSYPINVNCHNGKRDSKGHWCVCNPGWDSAPFDHASFNPDVQLYHMCSVWTGEMTAEEARNITVIPRDDYKTTNVIAFTLLGVSFFVLCVLVGFAYYRQRRSRKRDYSQDMDEAEVMRLTNIPSDDSEDEF